MCWIGENRKRRRWLSSFVGFEAMKTTGKVPWLGSGVKAGEVVAIVGVRRVGEGGVVIGRGGFRQVGRVQVQRAEVSTEVSTVR